MELTTIELIEENYNLSSELGRISFLADLVNTPLSSVISNKDRLLNEVEEWIIYGS